MTSFGMIASDRIKRSAVACPTSNATGHGYEQPLPAPGWQPSL